MKTRNIVVIVVLLLILVLFLGYRNSQDDMGDVTGHVVKDIGAGEDDDSGVPEEDFETPLNGSASDQDEDPEPQIWTPPYEYEYDPEPYEPSDSDDEPTGDEPECVTDEDCIDDDGCTPEKCEFAGHPNAYCAHPITEIRHADGCCPLGAWVDTDSDCDPVCGNKHCEYGEHTEDCPEDCKYAGTGSGSGDDSGDDGGDSCEDCTAYPT
ncbi:hypothetical protein KY362_04165 [Candidatus Woesearchaeota archaeon]|nr:hypothetical protein [Candidatus Woesearchaeota archaeon]